MANETKSCADGLSRKEFIRVVVDRGAKAGTLAVVVSAFSIFKPAPPMAVRAASGGT